MCSFFKLWQVIKVLRVETLDRIDSHRFWFYKPSVIHFFPFPNTFTHISPECASLLTCTGAVRTLPLLLRCCLIGSLADWEQQVWLCKSEVSVFLSLLSLAALLLQEYRIPLWKVQFTTGVALPFQYDLSLICRGGSNCDMNGGNELVLFAKASFHSYVIQLVPVSLKWSSSLCLICCVFLSVYACSGAFWADNPCYHGDPIWESIIVKWWGWRSSCECADRVEEIASYSVFFL